MSIKHISSVRPSTDQSGYWTGVGFALLSGLGVIVMPTTARLAYENGSDTMTVALVRGLVATTILFLVLIGMRQKLSLPRECWRPSLIAGVAAASLVYGIYGAILTLNISLVILIIYLYPITIAVYEHIRGVVRLGGVQWVLIVVTCLGLGLVIGARFEEINVVGLALAFVGMFASVVITLVNHQVTQVVGSLRSNLYMSLWSAMFFAVILFGFAEFKAPHSMLGWGSLFANGVGYCVAWVAFFSASRILGATRASMITLVDPPMSVLVGWLVFGEILSGLQWIGFAAVLLALVLFERQAQLNARAA